MPQANLRTCLIFLSVVSIASSQSLAPKPLPKEPLEKYDNPPPVAPATAIRKDSLSGTIERLAVDGAGTIDLPRTWNGTMSLQINNVDGQKSISIAA